VQLAIASLGSVGGEPTIAPILVTTQEEIQKATDATKRTTSATIGITPTKKRTYETLEAKVFDITARLRERAEREMRENAAKLVYEANLKTHSALREQTSSAPYDLSATA
jgi:hypothetical protein